MKAGAAIRIPDAVVSRAAGREVTQPGLPGRWSMWSPADAGPGAWLAVPLDDEARESGVKWATVRVTEPPGERAQIVLLATAPGELLPRPRTVRVSR